MEFNLKEFLEDDVIAVINNSLAKKDKKDKSSTLAKKEETIKQHILELLEVLKELKELGYIKGENLYKNVESACVYHDTGKINKEFQKRIIKKTNFNEEKEVSHNVLSLFFIKREIFSNDEDYHKVCNAVLNHHNYEDNYNALYKKVSIIEELLEPFKSEEVDWSTCSEIKDIAGSDEAIKIKGYLHKCDYSASAGIKAEYENYFLENALKDLLLRWREENSKAAWNDLQNFCMENQDKNIIVVAQTGMGKTEAALHWIGNNKGFFILPIRTAINAMYKRIKDDILKEKNFEEKIALVHSSSLEYHISSREDINSDKNLDIIAYEDISKKLSLPLSISTLDQLFDFVFKYNGYELKLTTLSYSKIVIDEIQMYGPDILAYLVYGLKRVSELGGKVAILTATLPPFVRDFLTEKINFKFPKTSFTDDSIRHNIKIIEDKILAKDIYTKYIENKKNNKSNKILVVCNTIAKAQEIYKEVKEKLCDVIGDGEINLLHSKFIRKERQEKEDEILKFGKTYDENKNIDRQNGIWISTSIVEASLDIDFDYLFTELQDINSLFQRFGRCNRKAVKDNNENNCYVYTEIDEKYFIQGDRGFIDKTIYKLSKEAIKNYSGKISEKEKLNLIETYFTIDKIKNSDFKKRYKKIYKEISKLSPNYIDKKDSNIRNILSTDIIPRDIYIRHKEELEKLRAELKDKNLEREKRAKITNKILQYTVSVYKNQVYKVKIYDTIKISKFQTLYIVDCIYDELGYRKKKPSFQT